MTGNELQYFRRMFIEGCLKNTSKYFTKESILESLNEALIQERGFNKIISVRTFENDWLFIKNALKDNGLNLTSKRVGKIIHYQYEDLDFSISDINLSTKEIKKLADAVKFLQQIKGIDLNNDLTDIIQKLDAQVKFQKKKESDIISIQHTEPALGYHYIDDIYDSIFEQTVLKIKYHPFNKESFELIIHPYHLKQFNNRWFLFGWDDARNLLSNLALDRIEKISPTRLNYLSPDERFNPLTYFKDFLGVTKNENACLEMIELEIKKSRASYIITKPIHHSQTFKKLESGNIIISLNLIANKELIQLILGYGSDVTVLKPKSLREEIIQEGKKILANYSLL